MKKKYDIILGRLSRDFRLVPYGSMMYESKHIFINDDDLIMIKRGDRSKEIFLHIESGEIRLSPSLHSQHFNECSFSYFKKYLKPFINDLTGDDYNYRRMVLCDINDGFIAVKRNSVRSNDSISIKVENFRNKITKQSNMWVVWNNPKKVSRKTSNHLSIVS